MRKKRLAVKRIERSLEILKNISTTFVVANPLLVSVDKTTEAIYTVVLGSLGLISYLVISAKVDILKDDIKDRKEV
jgi:hypothetical protein